MALCNGRRREGSVKAARFVRVHHSVAESLDRFFPSLPDRCLKRGHLTKKEIRWNFLIAVCTSGAGVAGQEQAPLRRVVEDAERGWIREDASSLRSERIGA